MGKSKTLKKTTKSKNKDVIVDKLTQKTFKHKKIPGSNQYEKRAQLLEEYNELNKTNTFQYDQDLEKKQVDDMTNDIDKTWKILSQQVNLKNLFRKKFDSVHNLPIDSDYGKLVRQLSFDPKKMPNKLIQKKSNLSEKNGDIQSKIGLNEQQNQTLHTAISNQIHELKSQNENDEIDNDVFLSDGFIMKKSEINVVDSNIDPDILSFVMDVKYSSFSKSISKFKTFVDKLTYWRNIYDFYKHSSIQNSVNYIKLTFTFLIKYIYQNCHKPRFKLSLKLGKFIKEIMKYYEKEPELVSKVFVFYIDKSKCKENSIQLIIFLSTLVNVFQDDSNLSTFLSTCIIKLNKEMDFVKLKNEKNPDYLYFKLLISLCFFKISQKTNKYLPHIMNIFIENLKFFFSVFQSSKSENFAYNTNHLTTSCVAIFNNLKKNSPDLLSNAICTTLKLIGMYIKFGIKNRKFSPIQIEEYINKLNPHYYENSSIQKRLQKTIKIIKIGKLPSKVSKRKHTAIKMLEPKLNFDEPLENTKLKPKKKIIDRLRIKREKRCAIKEIRRDNALINNEKFKTILENDNIRMKKVNKIMEQLKTQEHEFKKSK